MAIRVGPIKRLALLGGGSLLCRIADWARERMEVLIVTAPRHEAQLGGRPCICVSDIDEAADACSGALGLSFGAAWIFRRPTIDRFATLLNVHGTALPLDRGGGDYSWRILRGDRHGMALVHLVDEGLDTGDIVAWHEYLFPPECRTTRDYHRVADEQTFTFLTGLLSSVAERATELATTMQPEYLSAYWPRLNTDIHGWIDWGLPADELERFICAFDEPFAGARCRWRDKTVRLKSAMVQYNAPRSHPFQSGLVFRNNGRWLHVAATGGELLVQRVLTDDGRDILPEIRPGDRFYTTPADLEQAKQRVFYTASGLKTAP